MNIIIYILSPIALPVYGEDLLRPYIAKVYFGGILRRLAPAVYCEGLLWPYIAKVCFGNISAISSYFFQSRHNNRGNMPFVVAFGKKVFVFSCSFQKSPIFGKIAEPYSCNAIRQKIITPPRKTFSTPSASLPQR